MLGRDTERSEVVSSVSQVTTCCLACSGMMAEGERKEEREGSCREGEGREEREEKSYVHIITSNTSLGCL